MSKKAGIAIITLGVVLIASALLLFLYNQHESNMAGQEAESLMSDLESWLQEYQTESVVETTEESIESTLTEETESTETTLEPEMPVESINGYAYVGYVEIPSLELKLPVLSEWNYDRLQVAPCRQHGSSRTDDLVIAAHNYRTHFGRLKELSESDTVMFTDMDGIVNTYTVAKIDTIDQYDVASVLNSEFDLVLYTCTADGKTRVTVFCNRAEEEITE